jgi:hypothetical protein
MSVALSTGLDGGPIEPGADGAGGKPLTTAPIRGLPARGRDAGVKCGELTGD